MTKQEAYEASTNDKINQLIGEYIERFFEDNQEMVLKIRNNIWAIREEYYSFNIVITSLLIIFDAVLYEVLPEKQSGFFKELLLLNAHHTKSSKLCLVKDSVHIRIIRGLEDFDYSEFAEHIKEFRELYPDIKRNLDTKYYEANQ